MSNGFAEAYKLDVNLEFIKKKSGFTTDKELANALGVSQAQINAVKQNGKIPGVDPFLMNLSRLSGYSINDLLLEDLEDREMTIVARAAVSVDEHRKLIGLYNLYYFGTSSFKGRETSTDAAALESDCWRSTWILRTAWSTAGLTSVLPETKWMSATMPVTSFSTVIRS